MGTHLVTQNRFPTPPMASLTLPVLSDLSASEDVRRFVVRRPISPIDISGFLLLIDLTAVLPLTASEPMFETLLFSEDEFPSTEISLGNTPVSSTFDVWISEAVRSLADFQQRHPGWDGGVAMAFSAETLDTVRDALHKIYGFTTKKAIHTKPDLVPLDDGSIRFEWVNGDKELFLTILGTAVEVQKWCPITANDSEYQVIGASEIESELEWLAA